LWKGKGETKKEMNNHDKSRKKNWKKDVKKKKNKTV